MKDKRYKRMKKAILAGASSGIVAGMLIMGSGNTAFAETAWDNSPAYTQLTQDKDSGMHMMRRWNNVSKASGIAQQLGLNPEQVTRELKEGKTMKQILQENGLAPQEVQKVVANRKSVAKRVWKNMNNPYF